MKPSLVVHIGAPKTGTTYLQSLLWANKAHLADQGVLLPGDRQRFHFRAGADLYGDQGLERTRGPGTAGYWKKFVKAVKRSSAATVVLTDERLAGLPPSGVELVRELSDEREIHIIYGVRNLASLLPSAWQTQVRHGTKQPFLDWTKRILTSAPGDEDRPQFWERHDVADVVRRWSEAVSEPSHIHVLTVPARSAGPDELWKRFAKAGGFPSTLPVMEAPRINTTLDYAQTEFMRRVNAELADDLAHDDYRRYMRNMLSHRLMAGMEKGGGPKVPPRLRSQIDTRAGEVIDYLKNSDVDFVGDIEDLTPELGPKHNAPSDEEVLNASVEAMAALMRALAKGGRPLGADPPGQ
ncbi:MAG: hypothetical protein HKN91_06505 [Acidimicrobiia bacterium]|nr:hypothetical protein [Acidimicrobiia bacterium]